MIDVATLQGWIEKLGYDTALDGASTLKLTARDGAPLPSFFVQCTENWVLLSVLGLLEADAFRADDLGRRLLAANRELRVVKFALDESGEILLCAELPTESLDYSELADAVSRIAAVARRFQSDFLGG